MKCLSTVSSRLVFICLNQFRIRVIISCSFTLSRIRMLVSTLANPHIRSCFAGMLDEQKIASALAIIVWRCFSSPSLQNSGKIMQLLGPVAQWRSRRLITARLKVRILPGPSVSTLFIFHSSFPNRRLKVNLAIIYTFHHFSSLSLFKH